MAHSRELAAAAGRPFPSVCHVRSGTSCAEQSQLPRMTRVCRSRGGACSQSRMAPAIASGDRSRKLYSSVLAVSKQCIAWPYIALHYMTFTFFTLHYLILHYGTLITSQQHTAHPARHTHTHDAQHLGSTLFPRCDGKRLDERAHSSCAEGRRAERAVLDGQRQSAYL